ncbi:MAG TPA: LytTR family DNA-binding domain-containing protein [Gemmatimonadaceae bacterium]|nr:LytTR family DNA-binding domain-containing protein [Gemmatimonadaceae bacterium]
MSAPKWKVLVADDEPAARRGVRQLLAPFSEFAVVGECRDGREVLVALDSLKPDVLFLDIQMPEVDGFEVIRRKSPEKMPAVVFLTAYDQFAIRAFEAEAQDYLLKPVTEGRFAATMKRLTRRLTEGPSARDKSLIVPTARGAVVIPLHEIDWIEAADYYSRVWSNGRSYLMRESLDALEKKVGGDGFARAHRKALVRLGGVRELRRTSDGLCLAVLANGARIPVSRRRRSTFAAAVRNKTS